MTPGLMRSLQSIRSTLAEVIAPELRSDFTAMVLAQIDRVLAEMIVREKIAAPMLVEFIILGHELVCEGVRLLGSPPGGGASADEVPHLGLSLDRLYAMYDRTAESIENFVFALHSKARAGDSLEGATQFMARAAGWEAAYFAKRSDASGVPDIETASGKRAPSTDELNQFLQQRSLMHDGERVEQLDRVGGGFSKSTFVVHIDGGRQERRRLVMRRNERNPLLTDACFRLENEFKILDVLHSNAVLVPKPLLYEPTDGALGGDLILMEFVPGSIHGTVIERESMLAEDVFVELATELARLHQIPLDVLGGSASAIFGTDAMDQSISERNLQLQHTNLQYWLERRKDPSPVAARAFAWLLENVPPNDGRPTLIHGDLGLHNVMVNDGRLSAILDWESAQIGDPAQDLSSLRDIVSAHMDWNWFLQCYYAAGGPQVDERSLRFHALSRSLRTACIISTAGAMFESKEFEDIKAAVLKISFMPVFIAQTASLTEQFAAETLT